LQSPAPAAPLDSAGCPPDSLLRAAVLNADEAVAAHIAGCAHCRDVYLCALGDAAPALRGH